MSKHCKHIKDNGNPCSSFAINQSEYCLSHDPNMQENRIQRAKKGGSSESYKNLDTTLEPVNIHNSHDILQALVQVINELRTGHIPPKIATTIGYLLGMATKAYEVSVIEKKLEEIKSALQK